MVVNHFVQQLTLIVAERIDERCVAVAPLVDEVAEACAEPSAVPSFLKRELLRLSIFQGDINLAVKRVFTGCLIVDVARLLIVAIHIGDTILGIGEFLYQRTRRRIEIELHHAVAIAGQQDVVVG